MPPARQGPSGDPRPRCKGRKDGDGGRGRASVPPREAARLPAGLRGVAQRGFGAQSGPPGAGSARHRPPRASPRATPAPRIPSRNPRAPPAPRILPRNPRAPPAPRTLRPAQPPRNPRTRPAPRTPRPAQPPRTPAPRCPRATLEHPPRSPRAGPAVAGRSAEKRGRCRGIPAPPSRALTTARCHRRGRSGEGGAGRGGEGEEGEALHRAPAPK